MFSPSINSGQALVETLPTPSAFSLMERPSTIACAEPAEVFRLTVWFKKSPPLPEGSTGKIG